jgi:hypothetical protein
LCDSNAYYYLLKKSINNSQHPILIFKYFFHFYLPPSSFQLSSQLFLRLNFLYLNLPLKKDIIGLIKDGWEVKKAQSKKGKTVPFYFIFPFSLLIAVHCPACRRRTRAFEERRPRRLSLSNHGPHGLLSERGGSRTEAY